MRGPHALGGVLARACARRTGGDGGRRIPRTACTTRRRAAEQVGAVRAARACSRSASRRSPGSFTHVGHEPLQNRGMNAAIAVNKRFVYVGSRTDGKQRQRQQRRRHGRRRREPGAAVHRAPDGAAARGQPAGVLARAARVALAGRADRPAHQLRRRDARTCASSRTAARVPLLRHHAARTPRTRSCCTRTRWTRTSSSSGRTRRTRSAR